MSFNYPPGRLRCCKKGSYRCYSVCLSLNNPVSKLCGKMLKQWCNYWLSVLPKEKSFSKNLLPGRTHFEIIQGNSNLRATLEIIFWSFPEIFWLLLSFESSEIRDRRWRQNGEITWKKTFLNFRTRWLIENISREFLSHLVTNNLSN